MRRADVTPLADAIDFRIKVEGRNSLVLFSASVLHVQADMYTNWDNAQDSCWKSTSSSHGYQATAFVLISGLAHALIGIRDLSNVFTFSTILLRNEPPVETK